ncbi:MAG: tRNA-dihydrouridine synthase, partial [Clostridia bacterium]|nr:tRNA-dihydrouridine synthase [Clostridia bacterium]
LLTILPSERPCAIQLFGDDPDIMAKAALDAYELVHPDWVDINMGCPAPKIAGNHCGSALMRDPLLCEKIVSAITKVVPVPVTAKIRKGYAKDEVNAVEVAKALESGGASMVTVHGRTRDQMYAPPVDWDCIRDVKQAISIPVVGNGDVIDGPSAKALYEHTGCDMVMVGRGALGRPWVFAEIKAFLEGKPFLEPSVEEKMQILLRQVRLTIEQKGEKVAMVQSRKHTAWYMKGMQGASEFRKMAGTISHYADLEMLCEQVVLKNR